MAALVSASGGSSDGRWFGHEAAVAGTWLGFGVLGLLGLG